MGNIRYKGLLLLPFLVHPAAVLLHDLVKSRQPVPDSGELGFAVLWPLGCALVGIFVLTQAFGKRLSQFTADLCQTLDYMIATVSKRRPGFLSNWITPVSVG